MALVDTGVADALATQSPARVLEIAAAKIIEADPVAHAAKVEEQKRRRYVTLTRSDDHGHRCLVARLSLGDSARLDALVDRVADLLEATYPDAGKDERRSIALGLLARPLDVLQLLLAHGEDPSAADRDLLTALENLDSATRAKLRPRTILYVHLHQAALAGPTAGLARCEGLGPVLAGQVADLVGHGHLTVQPVLDLNDAVSVNAYEHPEWLKDRVWLTAPGDHFPHATGMNRHAVDYDHPTPFRPAARPDRPAPTTPHP